MKADVLQGDALTMLRTLPDGCCHTCVTSPPYYGLRDYGTGTWLGGDANCDHKQGFQTNRATYAKEGETGNVTRWNVCGKCGAERVDNQLGLEDVLDCLGWATGDRCGTCFICRIVDVFREVRRVLRDDGTAWVNMGDSYCCAPNGRSAKDTKASGNDDRTFRDKPLVGYGRGLKPKDLCMQPARVAMALQYDGWYLRSDIIWAKSNAMPESVTDRPAKSHEYIFLLAKSSRYAYDADAIKEAMVTTDTNAPRSSRGVMRQVNSGRRDGKLMRATGNVYTALAYGDRPQSVPRGPHSNFGEAESGMKNKRTVWQVPARGYADAHFATFPPALIKPCIMAGCPEGGTVLDPFAGSGTTLLVANSLCRNAIGIELNPEYVKLIEKRLAQGLLDWTEDDPRQQQDAPPTAPTPTAAGNLFADGDEEDTR